MNITVLWNVTSYSLTDSSQVFTGIYCFHRQGSKCQPEEQGSRFLRNIATYLPNYFSTPKDTDFFSETLLIQLIQLLFYREEGGSRFLRNFPTYLPNYSSTMKTEANCFSEMLLLIYSATLLLWKRKQQVATKRWNLSTLTPRLHELFVLLTFPAFSRILLKLHMLWTDASRSTLRTIFYK